MGDSRVKATGTQECLLSSGDRVHPDRYLSRGEGSSSHRRPGRKVLVLCEHTTLSRLPAGPLVPQFPHLSHEQEKTKASRPAQISPSRSARAPVARVDPF